ncbi:NitT/TauT family transport system permease protein OS=Streptomyces albaduncus OX=68172 GN=FHS32_001343 PE=3 SV=1 [Streptomyces griseoloalbus]
MLGDLAGLNAGLDVLESVQAARRPLRQTLTQKVLPPVVAVSVVLAVWQSLITFDVVDDPTSCPAPADVWHVLEKAWLQGEFLGYIWTSVSRGLLGFGLALLIATPLGLLLARLKLVRAAIGPILSGLQSLPSVAWVPPAGHLARPEQPDDVRGHPARRGALHCQRPALRRRPGPAAVPARRPHPGRHRAEGHLAHHPARRPPRLRRGPQAGLAFSWRSLMAAEIIPAPSPQPLGVGRQLLENGRNAGDMAMVFEAILLILAVGIAVDLLIFSPLERRVLRTRGLLVKS